MDPATHIQPLPLWVLLACAALLAGVITLFYTQGNWRAAITLAGFILSIILLLLGFDHWKEYLNSHFIGGYDAAGDHINLGGPGAIILWKTWPMWAIPLFFIIALAIIIDRIIISLTTKKSDVISPAEIETESTLEIAQQLESSSIKQKLNEVTEKLTAAIATAETQIDKNLELEIKLTQAEDLKEKIIQEAREKLSILHAELNDKKNQNEALTLLTLQQAEEIIRLKNQR